MIAYLKGTVVEKIAPVMVLDVQGIGYEVKIPMSSFYDLPEENHSVTLYTHVIYREDAQNLFGFIRRMERDFFRELIKINGVGPMMALTLLSGLTVESCIESIQDSDVSRLVQLPGIGRRTAERLIVEMRPCVDRWLEKIEPQLRALNSGADKSNLLPQNTLLGDAEAALLALGYKASDAKKALKAIDKQDSSEEMIRLALRQLVR